MEFDVPIHVPVTNQVICGHAAKSFGMPQGQLQASENLRMDTGRDGHDGPGAPAMAIG